jgi:hypothetical protein
MMAEWLQHVDLFFTLVPGFRAVLVPLCADSAANFGVGLL